MSGPSTMVDVREMLCAQALARVAKAVERLTSGEILAVVYGDEDVKRDLLAWAQDRGHAIRPHGVDRLWIERGRSLPSRTR